ncbi:hypothetical protein CH304_19600 [Rhodococcus sp. 15-649-1-2]|nr:hypothetical protein CH304_19600 [Rhodococcus sp. 15-649-1-2]
MLLKLKFHQLARALAILDRRISVQLTYIEMQHGRRRSAMDDFEVDADRNVSAPALWVVELYPPSEAHSLLRAFAKNRWEAETVQVGFTPPNASVASDSRAAATYPWWTVCDLANNKSQRWTPGATRTRLPDEFDRIKITGLQVGRGITALLAYFTVSEASSKYLNDTWHRTYTPKIIRRRGQLAQAQGPAWVAFQRTQLAREELHVAARAWMSSHAPGAFASSQKPQPLFGSLFFGGFGPTKEVDFEGNNQLRALGIKNLDIDYILSDELPGLAFEPADSVTVKDMTTRATWTLWGDRETFYDGHPHVREEGGRHESHIAQIVDTHARNVLVQIANTHFLEVLQERFASVRDTARTQNRHASARSLRALREELVTLSLDTSSANSDLKAFNRILREVRYEMDVRFTKRSAPWIEENDRSHHRTLIPRRDFSRQISKQQRATLKELVAAERDTRTILTAAASITAALQGLQASKVARWIAFVSLAVAVLAFLLADPTGNTRISWIRSWWFASWNSRG